MVSIATAGCQEYPRSNGSSGGFRICDRRRIYYERDLVFQREHTFEDLDTYSSFLYFDSKLPNSDFIKYSAGQHIDYFVLSDIAAEHELYRARASFP